MDQSTLEMTWAQVGQVDLFRTKIGGKYLMLGLKIKIKVIGNGLLVERTGSVLITMLYSEYFDQTRFPSGVISPTTLTKIVWPKCSYNLCTKCKTLNETFIERYTTVKLWLCTRTCACDFNLPILTLPLW